MMISYTSFLIRLSNFLIRGFEYRRRPSTKSTQNLKKKLKSDLNLNFDIFMIFKMAFWGLFVWPLRVEGQRSNIFFTEDDHYGARDAKDFWPLALMGQMDQDHNANLKMENLSWDLFEVSSKVDDSVCSLWVCVMFLVVYLQEDRSRKLTSQEIWYVKFIIFSAHDMKAFHD